MAWGALIKGAVKSTAKRVAVNKLMGRNNKRDRRRNVKNVMQQQGEYGGGGALSVRPSAPLIPSQVSSASSSIVPVGGQNEGGLKGTLFRIKTTTISIDTFLKDSYRTDKDQQKDKVRLEEQEKRGKRERELEKKEDKESKPKGMSVPLPKLGFFGMLKKFIFNMLFGWLTIKLIDMLPQLQKYLNVVATVADSIIDWGGKWLNALASIINVGYKMVTGVEKKVGDLFGQKGVDTFNKFTETFTKLMNVALIAALIGARGGAFGGGKVTQLGRSLGGAQGGFRRGSGNVLRRLTGGTAQGTRNSMIRRYSKRYGEQAALERFGKKGVQNVLGKQATRGIGTKLLRKGVVTVLGKGGTKQLLKFSKKFISPIIKKIPIIGALLDFALNFFVFKEPLGKAAFMAIGAGLGAWLGGMLGTLIPVPFVGTAIGAFLGGMGGDLLGGIMYDVFFGGKKSDQSGTGQEKVKKGKRAWWDFLGWAGTGRTEEEQAQADKEWEAKSWWDFLGWAGTGKRNLAKENNKKLRGGFIPKETTTLLHAGEFVVDADTTIHIRDLLSNLNAASTKDQVINVIRSYAEYEIGATDSPVTVVLPTSMTKTLTVEQSMSEGIEIGGSSSGRRDPSMDLLYKG